MGTSQEITWTKTGAQNDYVNITLFKSGTAVLNIGTTVDNSGSFFWDVPGTLTAGTDYVIRVETVDGIVVDDSGQFTINNNIVITSPVSSTEWVHGSTYDITWTSYGSVLGNVKIRLYVDGVIVYNVVDSTSNNGSFSFTVPDTLTPDDYVLRVKTIDNLVYGDSDAFIISALSSTPTLTVTSPVSSSVWGTGTTHTITWNKTGTQDANVKVELFKGGNLNTTLSSSTSNDGSYSWTISGGQAVGTDYMVRITTLNGQVTDDSDTFEISTQTSSDPIVITSPTGSTEWIHGQTYNITWDVNALMHNTVKIRLYVNGVIVYNVVDSTPNDGSFPFTVPDTLSPNTYVLRVKTIDNLVYGDSDPFTISEPYVTPTITITSPASSSDWGTGTTHTITWNKTGTQDANVKVELFKGGNLNTTLSSSTSNDGSYSWTISGGQAVGTDYMVRITTLNGQVTDDSDTFEISTQTSSDPIVITSPTGSTEWIHGQTYNITWDVNALMHNTVKIRLYVNGVIVYNVVDSTPNDGSFPFTVPDTLSPNTYVLRVKTIDNLVYGDSDPFTISEPYVTPTITITSPASSSDWGTGTTHTITWNKTGTQDANVKVELFKGGNLNTTLSSSTSNDGSYSWTISGGQAVGTDYMVRITTLNGQVTDDSDTFEISTQTSSDPIVITSPTGSTEWIHGQTYNITWDVNALMHNTVKIRLYVNGVIVYNVVDSTPNDGSFPFTVPDTLSPNTYVLRVKTIDNLVYGDSEPFSIAAEVSTPTINVTSPIPSSYWVSGLTYAITWDSTGNQNANVKIDLFKGGFLNSSIVATTPNSGSYSWTIDGAQAPGNDYVVRVTTVDDLFSDDSDQFEISDTPPEASLDITSPTGDTEWNAGSNVTITWDKTGPQDANVGILLYSEDNSSSTIISSTPNDGSYTWNIGSGIPSGRYYVSVKTLDSQVEGNSNMFNLFGTGITIKMPETDDTFIKGQNFNITWQKVGSQHANVKLRIYQNGVVVYKITDSTSNDGSYSWAVPMTLADGDNYVLRVKTIDNLIYGDTGFVRIASDGLLVTSPSTNDVLKKEQEYTITWSSFGSVDSNVKIRVYQGETILYNVVDSTPNNGSYTWTVPDSLPNASDLAIRVKTIDNLDYDDSGLITVED